MKEFLKKLSLTPQQRHFRDSVIHLFLISAVVILFSSNLFLYSEVKRVSVKEDVEKETSSESPLFSTCTESCRAQIQDIISASLATASGTPKPVTVVTTPKKERTTSYITLGSTSTTTDTDWVDLEDTEVYIDLANDYGESAEVSWEASLKVNHANGTAYARLYDATSGVVVPGSELSVTDKDELTFVSSGKLALWSGRNLYRVQIKSLNSFEITYSGGRIKIQTER